MTKDTSELISNLRDNADMLKDGLQLPNLTEAWHNEAMKHAAADSLEAAALISSLVAENAELLNRAEVAEYKQAQAVNEIQPMIIARAESAERLLTEARAALEPFADFAEYLEVETEGFSDTDELDLCVEESGFRLERFKVGAFRKARASIGGGNG